MAPEGIEAERPWSYPEAAVMLVRSIREVVAVCDFLGLPVPAWRYPEGRLLGPEALAELHPTAATVYGVGRAPERRAHVRVGKRVGGV